MHAYYIYIYIYIYIYCFDGVIGRDRQVSANAVCIYMLYIRYIYTYSICLYIDSVPGLDQSNYPQQYLSSINHGNRSEIQAQLAETTFRSS
jgi:hypothetical protein